MSENNVPVDYSAHGRFTDPGQHSALFDALPGNVENLCSIAQGLFIHDYFGAILYGEPPQEPPWKDCPQSRETLPVVQRLGDIVAKHDLPLETVRPVFERSVGTCRDFALMLCSMLRHQGVPARVRCGFARYFGVDCFQDHWLVEYWSAGENRWIMADAQLDDAHRQHLSINFPIEDVPQDQFRPATTAWQMIRSGSHDAARFGSGETTGEWFMHMNLMRDILSLQGQEVSAWDAWRDAPEPSQKLDDETR